MNAQTKNKLNLLIAIALTAVTITVVIGIAHLTITGNEKFAGVDFYDYYYAGKLVYNNPYDGEKADEFARADKIHAIEGSHYIYPPPFLLVAKGFGVMFPRPAALIFYMLSLGLLMLAAWRLAKYAQVTNKIALTALWVLFLPTLFTLLVGQVNAILLALAVLALDDALKGEDYRAGVWIGIGVCIKLTPAVLLVPLLFRGKWKSLVTATTVFVGTSAFAEFLSPGAHATYYGEVLPSLWNMQAHHAHPANQSIRGYFLRLCHDTLWSTGTRNFDRQMVSGMIMLLSGLLVAIGIVAVKFSAENKLTRSRLYLEASVMLMAITMASPLGWDHTYIVLLIPMTFLLRQKKRWATALVIISYLLMLLQRAVFIPFADDPAAFPFLRKYPGLSCVTLLAAFILFAPILEQLFKKKET